MIKSISTALAAIAVVTFAGLTGQASAQGCSSCSSANSFGFPAAPVSVAGCGHGGCGHGGGGKISAGVHELRRQLDHTSQINAKVAARNDAWPLPFACADKRDYYRIWDTMLNAGIEENAVLDANFFTEDNRLNNVGIDRVAGIVLNMPTNERTLFVYRVADESVNQARVTRFATQFHVTTVMLPVLMCVCRISGRKQSVGPLFSRFSSCVSLHCRQRSFL